MHSTHPATLRLRLICTVKGHNWRHLWTPFGMHCTRCGQRPHTPEGIEVFQ
ncbi:MAG: hypothetical protein ACRCZP_10800 [Phycicoccus sp.]